jgi:hypothetical protein
MHARVCRDDAASVGEGSLFDAQGRGKAHKHPRLSIKRCTPLDGRKSENTQTV